MKKASKAYSHKDQMMILEEKRKEMIKKRKEGKLELTPKQKEIMKIELEKESNIRTRYDYFHVLLSLPLLWNF